MLIPAVLGPVSSQKERSLRFGLVRHAASHVNISWKDLLCCLWIPERIRKLLEVGNITELSIN